MTVCRLCVALALLVFSASLHAQNSGGVFGPVVKLGHKSAQYRWVKDPDADTDVQRLHYQQALNDKWMLRGVGQLKNTFDDNQQFDFFQAEILVELNEESSRLRHGLRFDVRVRDEGRPGHVGLHFPNEYQINPSMTLRAVLLTFYQFGDKAEDDVLWQTRTRFDWRLAGKKSIGLEFFNVYGALSENTSFDKQKHQIGPYLNAPIPAAKNWRLNTSLLFGLTSATSDLNVRIFLGRKF